MKKGDESSPSIILASRALLVKMLITLEPRYAFGSIYEYFFFFISFYAPAIPRMLKGIKRCPCLSVRVSVRASFCASIRPSFKWVLCERNSSYNFIPILLKLYRCFCQGMKMCMTFGYNSQINFCHFFHSLNFVIFGLNYY